MVRDAVLRTAPHHEAECFAPTTALILRSGRSPRLEGWLQAEGGRIGQREDEVLHGLGRLGLWRLGLQRRRL
jgi:hypothetical protein